MKHSHSTILLLTTILLISLACNFISQPAQTQAPPTPTSSIYATSISVGGTHACALLNNGHVACWGDNSSGQLGDGTYTKHATATEVPGLTDIVMISAGGQHTCAVTKDGQVKCWGYNYSGQLGNGTKTSSPKPVDVTDLTNVTAISSGSEHTCAVLSNQSVKCWGKNLNGRLGDGSAKLSVLSPVDVIGVDGDIQSVSAGEEHTCALSTAGNVQCWGRNAEGQLGNGEDTNRSKSPVNVVGMEGNAISLASGFSESCAVTKNGGAKCWGWISALEFGNTPLDLEGLNGKAKSIAAGGDHVCVLLESGMVGCLGTNTQGQLGNGGTVDSQTLVAVKDLPGAAIAISTAFDFTCALTTAGEVFCWGDNVSGQLGNGTNEDSSTPVKVSGITQ